MGHRARREDTEITEGVGHSVSDRPGETVTIDAKYVDEQVAPLAKNANLSKFIL
ncbi:MAG: hypothetical protein ABJ388_03810 [Alphaproteobacteria bacterium]|uniref:hypothetical protein n=1 Tax=Nisaea sp. TaxID=2024842 RepID=UPI003267C1C4